MFKTVTISYQRKLDKTENSLLFSLLQITAADTANHKSPFSQKNNRFIQLLCTGLYRPTQKKQRRQVYHLKRSQYAIHTSDILQCRTWCTTL